MKRLFGLPWWVVIAALILAFVAYNQRARFSWSTSDRVTKKSYVKGSGGCTKCSGSSDVTLP